MDIHKIVARDLPDLWFQAVHDVLDVGKKFIIDRGSYEGQTRLEFDYFIGHIKFPGTRPLLPEIPPALGIPNPVEHDYLYGGKGYSRSYVEYLMSARKEPGESYTYGERLTEAPVAGDKYKWLMGKTFDIINFDSESLVSLKKPTNQRPVNQDKTSVTALIGPFTDSYFINQIEWIIKTYKKHGHRNNQMVLQIAEPTDLLLKDPPCLRSIDTRIQDDALHFFVLFRSWDLWGGMPANLGAIQILKEYMAEAIGVKDGEMLVESKGLHLYGYAEKFAKIRCMK